MNRIVAFGNPLLDTIVLMKDNTLLKKYNLKSDGQKEIAQNEMKSLMEDIKSYGKTMSAGGCAQNTLKVIQWLLRKQFSTTIFGAVGDDNEGQMLQDILKRDGVETNYVRQVNYPTGVTVALVNGTNRSLVACLGAAEVLSLADLTSNPDIMRQAENADLIYMEGFFLTKRTEVAHFVLNYCNSHNKKFAFNLSGEYMCKEEPEILKYFTERSDIIFGNKKEFEALCSIMKQRNVKDLLIYLSKSGKIVAMTNGANPVVCVGDGGKSYDKVIVPAMKDTEIVDTTGAGDSFVAGFLVGHLLKRSLVNCCELGCYAAQEIIKRRGCVVPEHPPNVLL
ncbi:PfkB domain containing protein [Asbolus verrucosus]|uniref:Adenosine kinase n=1 Tax=Asbolus verrucosus TaxID=1661398 RepID=A0A482VXW8_ASBVE|nr:PfkB domain containing protein [Asbolus verrucosus]